MLVEKPVKSGSLLNKLNLLQEMTDTLKEYNKMTNQQELEEVLNTFRFENNELRQDLEKFKKSERSTALLLVESRKENKELKTLVDSLTKENNELVKGLGCKTCDITSEYKDLNNKIKELEEVIRKTKRCCNCKHHKTVDDIYGTVFVCTKDTKNDDISDEDRTQPESVCDNWEM